MLKISGKIPIKIHPLFWLLCLAIGWVSSQNILGTVVWVVVILVSVLVHEMGHALLALAFGQKPEITLFGLGGVTERGHTSLTTWKELLVVACGPLFGFGLALLCLGILSNVPIKNSILFYGLNIAYIVNIYWTILNLFPIQPLDGGKITLLILEKFFKLKGIKIAYAVSLFSSAVFGALFFILGQIIVGSLFLMFAFDSYRLLKEVLPIKEQDRSRVYQQKFEEANRCMSNNHLDKAKSLYKEVSKATKKGFLFNQSQIKICRILLQQNELNACEKKIRKHFGAGKNDLEAEKMLLKILYRQNRYKEAQKVGESLFNKQQDFDTTWLNALITAHLQKTKATLGWLRMASMIDKSRTEDYLKNTVFDFLRETSDFKKIFKTS